MNIVCFLARGGCKSFVLKVKEERLMVVKVKEERLMVVKIKEERLMVKEWLGVKRKGLDGKESFKLHCHNAFTISVITL